MQALAAVIRGLHAVMLPKACRPGWQRSGRAKERGRAEGRGEGRRGLERGTCLTGLEQVKIEQARASSLIIKGDWTEDGKSYRCVFELSQSYVFLN